MIERSISGVVVATSSAVPMRSARPKPIHRLCGRAMGSYVLDTLAATGVRQAAVVTGVEGARISKRLLEDPPPFRVRFAEQQFDRGDGDAVLLGLSSFDDDIYDEEDVLIVPADVPLLRPSMLVSLVEAHRSSGAACTVLAVDPVEAASNGNGNGQPVPTFARIARDRHGKITAIRSDLIDPDPDLDLDSTDSNPDRTDRTDRERDRGYGRGLSGLLGRHGLGPGETLGEAAAGVYCVRRGLLAPALRRTVAEGVGDRAHLSDVVAVLADSGHTCEALLVESAQDLLPVCNRLQLAGAEAELRRRTNRHWLSMGVTMVDPDRTYIDTTVELGTDVTIFPGTILQGSTVIGDGCELGPDVRLEGCRVGHNSRIEKTTAQLATIGPDCTVGPFAVLHPGADLATGTTTGSFYAGGRTP